MARKKKPTRKYTPRHEFRYCFAESAGGKDNPHPHYIFGEKGNKYYSLGLTTSPSEYYPFYNLSRSPNPKCLDTQVVLRKPFVEKKWNYSKHRKKKWKFSIYDMPIIRHIIKRFKKTK